MAKLIRQTATFHASPNAVYDALMTSKTHAKFTGAPAKISGKVGGTFSAYGDYISGKNLELVPGKKIVQTWYCTEFPDGHFSRVTFSLKKVKTGTRLSFTHSGIPDKKYKDLKSGWITHYWNPMKVMFDEAAVKPASRTKKKK